MQQEPRSGGFDREPSRIRVEFHDQRGGANTGFDAGWLVARAQFTSEVNTKTIGRLLVAV